jgi:two-component system, chemotaxis family, protein-glutamate methylesterase/glutaminase
MALLQTRPSGPIKVLIVDDSAVVRQILSRDLARDPGIAVVGTAPDPFIARDKIVELKPDVITLDVEMPRMDGITFLQALMKHHPVPVIICSSLTPEGSRTAVAAMEAGAVDVICKPNGMYSIENMAADLIARIKVAAKTTPQLRRRDPSAPSASTAMAETTDKIFAIGASTGGVQALTDVLTRFPRNAPGTVIVQHMPPKFTGSFAERLNKECHVEVREARNGDTVIPGRVLLAPGGFHMILRRSGAQYVVEITDGPMVHHQKPAVEVLFNSVARYAGANAVGAILTGMGADGAAGLLNMRRAGARTVAQDQATSVVWGMPGEAVKLNAAEKIVPLQDVAKTMLSLAGVKLAAA